MGRAQALCAIRGCMTFSSAVFGEDLSRILDILTVIQTEESKRFNREGGIPLIGIFTNPTGTSWFEADMLTRHFYAGEMALKDTLQHDIVPGARDAFEWTEATGMGITMLQVRQMLLSRYVEMAASLQYVDGNTPVPGPAVRATVRVCEPQNLSQPLPKDTHEWEIGHWTLRPTGPHYSQSNVHPPGMRPIWQGPVLMAIPNVIPVNPAQMTRKSASAPEPPALSSQFSPPTPIPESPEGSVPESPAQEVEGESQNELSPKAQGMPPPVPVRGPTWLTQGWAASMQSSPASPSYSEHGRLFDPPGMPEPQLGPNPEWYPGARLI